MAQTSRRGFLALLGLGAATAPLIAASAAPPATAPSLPAVPPGSGGVTASALGRGRVMVQWQRSQDPDCTGYVISTRRGGRSARVHEMRLTPVVTRAELVGLDPGMEVIVHVEEVNRVGSYWSTCSAGVVVR